jgi:hypothetical protein
LRGSGYVLKLVYLGTAHGLVEISARTESRIHSPTVLTSFSRNSDRLGTYLRKMVMSGRFGLQAITGQCELIAGPSATKAQIVSWII